MWDSLVNIIDRHWQERQQPRKRFARAILALHTSLENCHDCFVIFREEPSAANLNKWSKSLEALVNTISSIEPVLKIFQANLWAVLSLYCWEEFFLEKSISQDANTYERRLMVEHVKSYLAAIDLITRYDKRAKYDPEEEERHFPHALDQPRQELLKKYRSYLTAGKIDDHRIILKYRGELAEMDDSDFVFAIKALRDWVKKEFKPEELI